VKQAKMAQSQAAKRSVWNSRRHFRADALSFSRARHPQKGDYATYVVAEEGAAKAVAMIRTLVGPTPLVESIGRASRKLLLAIGLSAGEFKIAVS
jgi:hypothetical protein